MSTQSPHPTQATRPLLIAHRGACADYPENTRAAFDAALEAPIDGIELDLRPTKDGQVVVCHDATLARFHGSWKPLARQRLSQLQTIDVGSWFSPRFHQERLLSLEQLLESYATRTVLFLELKAAAGLRASHRNRTLCSETVRVLRRHRALQRVKILCFNASLLRMIWQLEPQLALVRNCLRRPSRLDAWLARQPPLQAIDLDHRLLTTRLVEDCHRRGLQVFTWSCNTTSAVTRARATGVDGILSDRPRWLCTTVRARG